MQTTIGQVLVNDALPTDLRDYSRILTSDQADNLLERVALDHPERYRTISQDLVHLGRNAAYDESATLSLSDMQVPMDRSDLFKHVRTQTRKILASKDMDDTQKQQALVEVYGQVQKFFVDNTYKSMRAKDNPFALQVVSRARGNPAQLAALMTTPGTYTDAYGNVIPVFVRHSYAEGLSPHEYWAGTYGARQGVVSTKFATRDAGDLGKQFNQAAMRMVVTEDDCGTSGGIPVPVDDKDMIGAVLARQAGKYPSGTVVSKEVLQDLASNDKFEEIVVRSPLTCGLSQGVCKHCTGLREGGAFPKIGDHVGINASSALAERIAQGSLNTKHCLLPSTEVLMADWTSRRMDALQVGDQIMGSDLRGNMRPVSVITIFDNGVKECWSTEFIQNGAHECTAPRTVLESTLEHEVLATRYVYGQTEEADNGCLRGIRVGQKSKQFYAMRPGSFDDTGLHSEPLALLCGLLLGDGCYTESVGGVYFSTADTLLKDELTPYLERNNLKFTPLIGHKYYHRVSCICDPPAERAQDGRYVTGSRNRAKLFLGRHDMLGKRAECKVIPDTVHTWDNQSVAQLLAGLIITDGSVYTSDVAKPAISFSSTSKQLVTQLRYLLGMRFGVWTSELTRTARVSAGRDGAWNRNFDQWQVTITSTPQVRRFAECIPLVGVKRDHLARLLAAYGTHRSNFCGLKRIKQSFIGAHPTMDIEVDHPDHMFVLSNGLIVSNSGGMTDSSGKKVYSGFNVIEQLFQVPKTFPHRAAVATHDGRIDRIEQAPQGGFNVYVGDETHYVLPESEVTVKEGDRVEAGDQLSTGILNPREVVRYKGIGEGRRYFTERAAQAFRESGYAINRRNLEILVRGMMDHAVVNDPQGSGDYLPGDIVSYNALAHGYRPRVDAQQQDVDKAVGQYLEQPILHHTIGTRITHGMATQLKRFGHNRVLAHQAEPTFEPYMVGLRAVPQQEKDWMAQLGSSHLQKNLLKNVQRSAESHTHGLHPIPGLAKGVDFGGSKEVGY
jgi:hypothetical protein